MGTQERERTRQLDTRGGSAEPGRVFEAPWQGRAFALAVSLCQSGLFPWRSFQSQLAARIRAWEGRNPGPRRAAYPYYQLWLETLEDVLVDAGVCAREELRVRAALPAGPVAAAPVAARRAPIAVDPSTAGPSSTGLCTGMGQDSLPGSEGKT